MSAAALAEVLNAEIACAREMLGALERERNALLDAAHAGLDEARADKDRLVAALERLEQRRLALTAGAPQAAHPEWHALLELVEACRDQNRRNGTLLGARRQAVDTVLKSLRGTASEPYGPDGRKPRDGAGRPLGSA